MLIRLMKFRFPRITYRCNSSSANSSTGSASGSNQGQCITNPPPGLSQAVITPTKDPVGPCVDPKKTGVYKVPEYFCYHNMSYFQAEIEMAQYRLPQPSAIKK
ncbi:hypothetical protein EVAR_98287_1 [Eumeta japonica]|uniref:Uncharacterized protein n=1 Tax=Eumeta variegata TaxID=151549 RepID=A0A4C1X9A2_EUMVA|nr:hypothetical protein EVAR_98287_1 [Eumeta japonica]